MGCEVTDQCGSTILHFRPFSIACTHFGWSTDKAQTCVVNLVRVLDSVPPMASTAPTIASWSPGGMSPQDTTTFENMKFGSGVKGRTGDSLLLINEACIQSARTTLIICSRASVYSGKSLVLDMICVNSLRSKGSSILATAPLWFSRISWYYICCQRLASSEKVDNGPREPWLE